MLSVTDIKYRIGNKEILKGISTGFAAGKLHVIVGPNGCGKSTFLKVFRGEISPQEGRIQYENKDIKEIDKPFLARMRAVMSQQPELHFPLTVEEIVMMGRYPHFNLRPARLDQDICRDAMKRMEVDAFTGRDYLTLSGGEKQRVQFARVLAQVWKTGENETKYLFLDEAVSHLDLKHQQQLLNEAKKHAKNGSVVICILHDLNLAITYANRILLMKDGRIKYELENPAAITSTIIKEIFEVEAAVLSNHQRPVIVF